MQFKNISKFSQWEVEKRTARELQKREKEVCCGFSLT